MNVREHLQRALALLRRHPVGALAHVRKAASELDAKPASKPVSKPKPAPKAPTLAIFGVDYAWGRKPYDALQKAGVKFVMRYISLDATKDLSKAELGALRKRGIKVGLVFEAGAKRALEGHATGAKDAAYCRSRARALGLGTIPIYFAVDWDATDADKPHVADYLKGAVSVLGFERVGVYGSYYVVRYMAQNGACRWFWQTYAWSGGLVHPQAHILQYRNGQTIAGLSVDFDKATTDPAGFGVA